MFLYIEEATFHKTRPKTQKRFNYTNEMNGMRSHIGWGREQNILYKGAETSL